MYQNDCSFDSEENGGTSENGFSSQTHQLPSQPPPTAINGRTSFADEENLRLSMEEFSYHDQTQTSFAASTALEVEFQSQLELENPYSTAHLVSSSDHLHSGSWVVDQHLPESAYPPPAPGPGPDLLHLFNLPGCPNSSSLLPDSSSNITFTQNPIHNSLMSFVGEDSASQSSILYNPLLHLNLQPPQPPLFREHFQSLPNGYVLPGAINGRGADEILEGSGDVVYQEGSDGRPFGNGIFEFSAQLDEGKDGKGTKHLATERQRRVQFSDKYKALKDLIPNPTKSDRASVVGDAIEYIRELLRTVNDLQLLVDRKRCGRENIKKQKTKDENDSIAAEGSNGDVESSNIDPYEIVDPDQSYNSSLRSTWLQRKSRETEVDIRIVDDEVTIKLSQRKKINLLLFASKVLNELHLDLHHVAGGHVGDYYSFLFNSKIYEGSSLHASAIANKLIEVLDSQYAAVSHTNSY